MTKYYICSIKDNVIGQFSELNMFVNEAQAKRHFNLVCSQSKVKNDLQLYKLGSYDLETGEIVNDVEFLVNGCDVEG